MMWSRTWRGASASLADVVHATGSPSANGWLVEHLRSDAATLHDRTPDVGHRQIWICEVDRPSLVIGSTQPVSAVDEAVATALGVQVVRRRSGGAAVLLRPGESVWIDVVVPAGDVLWVDDVGQAMWWLGAAWAAALVDLGVLDARVHRGAMVRPPMAAEICFAGVGPGEVLDGRAKVVGISQRRTRDWARLQCLCHLVWRPELVAALAADAAVSAADLASVVRSVDVEASVLTAAVVDQLLIR